MLKALRRLAAWLAAPADLGDGSADLLSHPAIERMNERELADLPFSPAAKTRAGGGCCPA